MRELNVRTVRPHDGRPSGLGKAAFVSLAVAGIAMLPTPALAAGGGGTAMPWEGPIQSVLTSLTGPVAQALCILAVVALGFGMAFSEGGGMMRRSMGILFGCSIAVTAVSFATTFFGFAAGAGM